MFATGRSVCKMRFQKRLSGEKMIMPKRDLDSIFIKIQKEIVLEQKIRSLKIENIINPGRPRWHRFNLIIKRRQTSGTKNTAWYTQGSLHEAGVRVGTLLHFPPVSRSGGPHLAPYVGGYRVPRKSDNEIIDKRFS